MNIVRMLTKCKIILVATAMLSMSMSSCDMIRDDHDDCGVWLEFIFDYNMEYTDSFDPQVKTVDVYLFDKVGRFVVARHAGIDDLQGRKRMFIGNGLPFGDYKILTVGNLATPFRFTDKDNQSLIPGVTTIEDVILSLNSGEASQEFDHLFFGPTVEVDFKADLSVWPIPLIRETNRFNIVLQTLTETFEGVTQGKVSPRHTVEIVAPEAGAYDYLNNPTDLSKLIYRPYSLLSELDHTTGGSIIQETVAHINTMRLLENEWNGYRIVVRDIASGNEIWSNDLLPLLAATKRPPRPDGTALPRSEYFDREAEWNIVIIYQRPVLPGTPGKSFVALRITINGWIVWQQDMGV